MENTPSPDAVIAQRDLPLAKLLDAHKALVRRFEQADAERTAHAATLADTEVLLALAEQEIAAREVHARGLLQAQDQRAVDVQQWRQRAEEAAVQAAARVDPAVARALEQALADADRRIGQLRDELARAHDEIRWMTGSRSWKITQPLRRIGALLGRTTDSSRREGLGNGQSRS
jgi:predicted  nucleic acid-binding Zn-ribbon protein